MKRAWFSARRRIEAAAARMPRGPGIAVLAASGPARGAPDPHRYEFDFEYFAALKERRRAGVVS